MGISIEIFFIKRTISKLHQILKIRILPIKIFSLQNSTCSYCWTTGEISAWWCFSYFKNSNIQLNNWLGAPMLLKFSLRKYRSNHILKLKSSVWNSSKLSKKILLFAVIRWVPLYYINYFLELILNFGYYHALKTVFIKHLIPFVRLIVGKI